MASLLYSTSPLALLSLKKQTLSSIKPFHQRLTASHKGQPIQSRSKQATNATGGAIPRRELLLGAAVLSAASSNAGVVRAEAESVVKSPAKESDTVFVIGATGATGSRVVKQLLARGVKVRAGVRDISKAQAKLGTAANLEYVRADVTEGAGPLAKAIGDAEAVVCATGFTPALDLGILTKAWQVDNIGTCNLVDAAKRAGAKKFVLVSSLLTNGAAAGQIFNRNYILLNLFGLVLVAKLQAENYLRKSGLDFTVVRPGGLSNNTPEEIGGNLVVSKEDTLFGGRISRDKVAEVVIESLYTPNASNKVVEIIQETNASRGSIPELLGNV